MIETERLHLRRFTDGDRDIVARWNADPDFTRHLAGVQTREQSDEAFDRWQRHWDERGFGLLAVTWKETGELIGRWLRMTPTGFEPVTGKHFTFQTTPGGAWDGVINCEVLEAIPNQRLAYSWKGGHESNVGYGAPLDTVVTFILSKAQNGTRLSATAAVRTGVPEGTAFLAEGIATDSANALTERLIEVIKP